LNVIVEMAELDNANALIKLMILALAQSIPNSFLRLTNQRHQNNHLSCILSLSEGPAQLLLDQ